MGESDNERNKLFRFVEPRSAPERPRFPFFLFAVATIGAATIAWVSFSPVAAKQRILSAEVEKLHRENQEIWWRNVEMGRRARALRASPVMIEREARRQMGYGKPDEEVFFPAPDATFASQRLEFGREAKPFSSRVWRYVRTYWAKATVAMLALTAVAIFMWDWKIEESQPPESPMSTG